MTNCNICRMERTDPNNDDGWAQTSEDPTVKEWACPTCFSNCFCPQCSRFMEEQFIKDDVLDGRAVSISRVNCLECGYSEVRYEVFYTQEG